MQRGRQFSYNASRQTVFWEYRKEDSFPNVQQDIHFSISSAWQTVLWQKQHRQTIFWSLKADNVLSARQNLADCAGPTNRYFSYSASNADIFWQCSKADSFFKTCWWAGWAEPQKTMSVSNKIKSWSRHEQYTHEVRKGGYGDTSTCILE